jgi:hypothetical protein
VRNDRIGQAHRGQLARRHELHLPTQSLQGLDMSQDRARTGIVTASWQQIIDHQCMFWLRMAPLRPHQQPAVTFLFRLVSRAPAGRGA